ncbi:hypothetical protein HDU81_006102 [Chytriomyces hyalinus]|nr:hypothetical protein HDU81_006102 [Chytriomyces hyalinus]
MSVTYDPSSHVSSSDFNLESSSGLSENLQEFLSTGLSGLSESPTPNISYLSGEEVHPHFPLTTSESMLQVLANSIIPLPEPHTSTTISIQAANTIDDEDIKAFLRWNSESDIEPTVVNSSSLRPAAVTENESSPTTLNPNASDFSSSLNLLPSPPITSYASESVLNQSPHFTSASFQTAYTPQTLSSLPHCHPIMPPYISYDDPRYTQNNSRMHGFELMTEGDQSYYGYGPTPTFTAAETEAAYNYYDAVAASMMSVYEQHHPIQDHSHAFRWAATANAVVPLSHVSMSMIVPEDQQNPQCIATQPWPMESVSQTVSQPQEPKLSKSGVAPTSGASGKKSCGPKSLQAPGQNYSPYKRASVNPPKSTPQMGRQSKRTPSVLMNQPSKFVGVQQLESQQLWFKTQLAEQEEMKKKVQAEREGIVAVLRQLVLKRGSVAAAAGKSECH